MDSNARNAASNRHQGACLDAAGGHLSLLARRLFAAGLLLLGPVRAGAGVVGPDRQEEIVAARIMRVLPGVIGIITEVSAEVTVRCGPKDTYVVKPDMERENGTGFIIHPDGWIATNGHVVKPVYKDDEEHVTDFLEQAAKTACGPGLKKLPETRRTARMAAILKDPENRKGVKLTKRLEVFLPTGEAKQGFPAVVKAYSPPIDPDLIPKAGEKPDPPMLDAAIIKIEAKNLPTVRLAPGIAQVVTLGQQLVIVGFPGVVVWHDFLSKKSRAEATVTFGRVSAFRLDVNERWILQTDAPISWGNSGGPAFSIKGEVVALATFISTSLEGDQAIQGFNFLIPIDSIHALAKQLGVTPSTDSPFTREWDQAGEAFIDGRFQEFLTHAEAADKLVPGLIDVRRAIVRVRARLGEKP
jgi:serine protease Do